MDYGHQVGFELAPGHFISIQYTSSTENFGPQVFISHCIHNS